MHWEPCWDQQIVKLLGFCVLLSDVYRLKPRARKSLHLKAKRISSVFFFVHFTSFSPLTSHDTCWLITWKRSNYWAGLGSMHTHLTSKVLAGATNSAVFVYFYIKFQPFSHPSEAQTRRRSESSRIIWKCFHSRSRLISVFIHIFFFSLAFFWLWWRSLSSSYPLSNLDCAAFWWRYRNFSDFAVAFAFLD